MNASPEDSPTSDSPHLCPHSKPLVPLNPSHDVPVVHPSPGALYDGPDPVIFRVPFDFLALLKTCPKDWGLSEPYKRGYRRGHSLTDRKQAQVRTGEAGAGG